MSNIQRVDTPADDVIEEQWERLRENPQIGGVDSLPL
jgi:hypothetical protein